MRYYIAGRHYNNQKIMIKSQQQLNILCIGERVSGKTCFLEGYTGSSSDHCHYQIYIKQIEGIILYFHQLGEENEVYLAELYDGILFFIDFLNFWNVQDNVLHWIETYSKLTGVNLFKIPIQIIIMKEQKNVGQAIKLKAKLQKELKSIVQDTQIIFYSQFFNQKAALQQYFRNILQKKAKGIKCTNYTIWKLQGVTQIFKTFATSVKLTFLRIKELYREYRRKRQQKILS